MNALHGRFLDVMSGLGIALSGEISNLYDAIDRLRNGDVSDVWRWTQELSGTVQMLSDRLDAMACSEGWKKAAVRLSKTAPLKLSSLEIVLLLFDRWACRCHALLESEDEAEDRRQAACDALYRLGPLRVAFDEFRRYAAKIEEESNDIQD